MAALGETDQKVVKDIGETVKQAIGDKQSSRNKGNDFDH